MKNYSYLPMAAETNERHEIVQRLENAKESQIRNIAATHGSEKNSTMGALHSTLVHDSYNATR